MLNLALAHSSVGMQVKDGFVNLPTPVTGEITFRFLSMVIISFLEASQRKWIIDCCGNGLFFAKKKKEVQSWVKVRLGWLNNSASKAHQSVPGRSAEESCWGFPHSFGWLNCSKER